MAYFSSCAGFQYSAPFRITYRSPYTRCLFLLGLLPGVLSLGRPADSKSFSLFDSTSASTDSETATFAAIVCTLLLVTVGGVFDPGGVCNDGVRGRSADSSVGIAAFDCGSISAISQLQRFQELDCEGPLWIADRSRGRQSR